jgi:hypothetical protein
MQRYNECWMTLPIGIRRQQYTQMDDNPVAAGIARLLAEHMTAKTTRERVAAMRAAVTAERERCKVLARWMIEAAALLAEYEQTDDSEDGGATARDLRWRGERLVQAVLDPGPN